MIPVVEPERIAVVARLLGYSFRDPQLAAQALRHASVGGVDGTDNERLEYLGDAAISLVVGALLYERHANAAEGELTERRARLVSRAHLARVAKRLGLEALLELRPALAPGTLLPDSVLAGALEALFGAVYLDGGFEEVARVGRALLGTETTADPHDNPKADLQHAVQTRFGCVPNYRVIEERVHPFGRTFAVAAEMKGQRLGIAWGRNKREAEQLAARDALLNFDDGAPTEP